ISLAIGGGGYCDHQLAVRGCAAHDERVAALERDRLRDRVRVPLELRRLEDRSVLHAQDASASSTDSRTLKCRSSPDTSSARRVSVPGAASRNACLSSIRLRASTNTPRAVESTNCTSPRSTTSFAGFSAEHASSASRTWCALYRSSSPARRTTTPPSSRSTPATGSTRPPVVPSTLRIQAPTVLVCLPYGSGGGR